jgi:diketogulonate reductase-like aldo/keto reductase
LARKDSLQARTRHASAGLAADRTAGRIVVMTQTVSLSKGVDMPMVGFGTWQISGRKGYDAVRHALDAGYRHIDTATMYKQRERGRTRAARQRRAREDVFVTTKLPPERSGRVRDTLQASLRALDVSTVDLWLIHWPPNARSLVSTWEQFIAARDEGLVRAIGVSNSAPTSWTRSAPRPGSRRR